ncbi:hypothetical protein N8Z78_00220 [Octadecabacter sp.]|nr:hypothetical protein [Octadecabacter sp.]
MWPATQRVAVKDWIGLPLTPGQPFAPSRKNETSLPLLRKAELLPPPAPHPLSVMAQAAIISVIFMLYSESFVSRI